jgi:tetratricopeptide (TPR) repeat protein
VGSLGQGVSALEVATGQRRWHFKTEEAVLRPPLVVDGGVYVASDSEYVYALDAATGELRWEFEATAKVADDLAVADGVVYVCTRDDELLALDALTGQVRWKFEAETGQLGRPLIAGELIYLRWSSAMGERASSCLYALEALAGEAREPALAWLSSLAEWAGEDYDAHWEVGRGFCRLEAYDQARREGERLRQLQPDNPEAPWFLSRVEFAARNWAASEALLRRVLQDRPRLWQAHYYLVRALLAQLREEYPQLAPVLNFSALEQELAGLPAAREAYQIFLQAEPEGAWADRARERLAALEAKEAKVP